MSLESPLIKKTIRGKLIYGSILTRERRKKVDMPIDLRINSSSI